MEPAAHVFTESWLFFLKCGCGLLFVWFCGHARASSAIALSSSLLRVARSAWTRRVLLLLGAFYIVAETTARACLPFARSISLFRDDRDASESGLSCDSDCARIVVLLSTCSVLCVLVGFGVHQFHANQTTRPRCLCRLLTAGA